MAANTEKTAGKFSGGEHGQHLTSSTSTEPRSPLHGGLGKARAQVSIGDLSSLTSYIPGLLAVSP